MFNARWQWINRTTKMDFVEILRRCKRNFEGYISYRKAFLLLTLIFGLFFYLGPWFFKWTTSRKSIQSDPVQRCIANHLDLFARDIDNFDAQLKKESVEENEKPNLPFVGNGMIGAVVERDSPLYIATQRVLSLKVPFYPIVEVNLDGAETSGVVITHFTSGTAQKFECVRKKESSIDIWYRYYAHRILPSVLVQDIKMINPLDEDVYLDIVQTGALGWKDATKAEFNFRSNGISETAHEIRGDIKAENNLHDIGIVVVQTKIPTSIRVRAHGSSFLHIVASIHYAELNKGMSDLIKDNLAIAARRDLERALSVNYRKFRENHVRVWQQLWSSGLSISYSKAVDALNGDKINATIYYLLSHTRSPLYEMDVSENKQMEYFSLLNQPDQCYAGHHTLQASKLWSDLSTAEDVIKVCSLWKLTLEKQGCQIMMQTGADGLMQALLLSFGAFKFSGHHLQFGMEPKDLHRDYLFRRISYGNGTHLNVSVVVGENNKATLLVVLDRSDKNYYACDGGCLDPPVQLSQEKVQFPVKLTDPHTSILYITSNKQHMVELKDFIHVREIVEAPAHEHHVIALHRHGHHFGGLPTMFWISITFLVAIFHLFLFKLIYNEYCNSGPGKFRARHSL